MGVVHQDKPGGAPVGIQVPSGNGRTACALEYLATDLDGAQGNLLGRRVVGRQLKILGQCVGLAFCIHQGGGVGREHGPEFGELLGFRIVEHPVLLLAGHDVDQAARLVRHDVGDALLFVGHPEVTGGIVARIVGDQVAPGILRRVSFLGIALFGPGVYDSTGTYVIAGVKLGLGGVALGGQAAHLVSIHHHTLLFGDGIEFHQVGVVVVLGGSDEDAPVVSLAKGKIPGFLGMGFRQDVMGRSPDVIEGGVGRRQNCANKENKR